MSAKLQDASLDSHSHVTESSILELFKQSEKAFERIKRGSSGKSEFTWLLKRQIEQYVDILNVSKRVRDLSTKKTPTFVTPEPASLASLVTGDVVELVEDVWQSGRCHPAGTVSNVVEVMRIGSGDGSIWTVKAITQKDHAVLQLKQFHTFVLLGSKSVDLKFEERLAQNVRNALGVNEVKCAIDLLGIAKGLAYNKTACDGDGLADEASGGTGSGWRSRRNKRLDRLIQFFNTLR